MIMEKFKKILMSLSSRLNLNYKTISIQWNRRFKKLRRKMKKILKIMMIYKPH